MFHRFTLFYQDGNNEEVLTTVATQNRSCIFNYGSSQTFYGMLRNSNMLLYSPDTSSKNGTSLSTFPWCWYHFHAHCPFFFAELSCSFRLPFYSFPFSLSFSWPFLFRFHSHFHSVLSHFISRSLSCHLFESTFGAHQKKYMQTSSIWLNQGALQALRVLLSIGCLFKVARVIFPINGF